MICHLRMLFPCWFSVWKSIHWRQWGVKIPSYHCITVSFSTYVHQDLLYIFRCSYIGCIKVYKGYILLLSCSLYHYVVFFFLIIVLVLKSILLDISIATLTFFSLPFAWTIFFHPCTFSLCVSFDLRCVSWRQHIYGSCFLINSAALCVLIGTFKPFTF